MEMFFCSSHFPQPSQNPSNLLLLSGPPSSGKTSLLFQFAFNVALHSHNVIFISNRQRLDSKPPFLSQGIDPSSHVFHRIQMKYVNDDEDIRKYFAAFHLYDKLPAAVLIDDFGSANNDILMPADETWPWSKLLPYATMQLLLQIKRGLARFSCRILILTRETLQGFTSSIRNGYKPLLLSKKGMHLDHLF